MHLGISNTFHIDFEAFLIILTFIYCKIFSTPQPGDLRECVVLGWGRRNTVIYAKSKVPESLIQPKMTIDGHKQIHEYTFLEVEARKEFFWWRVHLAQPPIMLIENI